MGSLSQESKQKKILFLVHRYHTNMIPLTEALVEHGHSVSIIATYVGPSEDHSIVQPIIIEPESLTRSEAANLLHQIDPDIIIIREMRGGYLSVARIGMKEGRVVLYYNQGPYYRNYGVIPALKDLRRLILRFIKRFPVRTITPVLGQKKGKPRLLTYYTPFPMPAPILTQSRNYCKEGIPKVLCVGKFAVPRKRHLFLLNALEELNADCKLIFVGVGDDSKLHPQKRSSDYYNDFMRRCKQTTLKREIDILENLSYNEMIELYRDCDVFVLPSENEPFAISPLEAMAAGCAVISSDTNGSSGYITHNRDGLIFRVNNYDDLSSKLEKLLSSKETIQRLGLNAMQTISKNHNYAIFVQNLLSIAKIN